METLQNFNGRTHEMKMGDYLKKRAMKHKVTHEFSGKTHYFKVESENGNEHSVSIQVGCDCTYMGVQGIARGEICSHILAVFDDIIKHGNIKLTVGSESIVQAKRNACTNLVRPSNRQLNEIRVSSGESQSHQAKKIEICKRLHSEGKHFMTEAIFEKGGRADILVLDTFTAIEIVHSETQESINKKLQDYPEGIKIEVVRC
jgi:hypothetical protein